MRYRMACIRWLVRVAVPQESKFSLQNVRCILCDGERVESQSAEDLQGGRCAAGHFLCAGCTSQYLELTLEPLGIVWWDTINCVDPGCTEYMEGMSVQRCIPQRLVERIDAVQLELVPMLGAEARRERERTAEAARLEGVRTSQTADNRASEVYVVESTVPCPRCGIASVKVNGCKHVKCFCRHEYCWDCLGNWVVGHMSVECAPR